MIIPPRADEFGEAARPKAIKKSVGPRMAIDRMILKFDVHNTREHMLGALQNNIPLSSFAIHLQIVNSINSLLIEKAF